jgi:uncharacterized membrane protein YtjA (UPF0391 family)
MQGIAMLKWALLFFLLSLVTGVFAFTGVAVSIQAPAQALFFLFLLVFLIFLFVGFVAGETLLQRPSFSETGVFPTAVMGDASDVVGDDAPGRRTSLTQ